MLPNIDMIYVDCTIEAFTSGNGRFGSLLGMPNRKYWQRSMLHGYLLLGQLRIPISTRNSFISSKSTVGAFSWGETFFGWHFGLNGPQLSLAVHYLIREASCMWRHCCCSHVCLGPLVDPAGALPHHLTLTKPTSESEPHLNAYTSLHVLWDSGTQHTPAQAMSHHYPYR